MDFPHHGGVTPQLSLPDTLQRHILWIKDGIFDACYFPSALRTVALDPHLTAPVLKSFLLNTLALLSLHGADAMLVHAGLGVRLFYHTIVSTPLLAVALYLNTTYCTQTAHRAFALHHGSRALVAEDSSTLHGNSIFAQIATVAPRLAMLGTAVALDALLRLIPWIGPPCAFLYLCWVDAYYYFELTHISRGLPLPRRAQYLEERWAYHLGFGLPSAALLTLGNSTPLSNAALFALTFPIYIVLATSAHPQPASRGDPVLDPRIPERFPLFVPILWADNITAALLTAAKARLGTEFSIGSPNRQYKQDFGSIPTTSSHGHPSGVASGYGRNSFSNESNVYGRRSFGDNPSPSQAPQTDAYTPGKASYSMGRYAGSFGEGWTTTPTRKYD